MARSYNTDTKYSEGHTAITKEGIGNGLIILEPVRATLKIKRSGAPTVNILDHNGRRTGRTLPVKNGSFTIDGAKDKTMYYEIYYK